MRNFRFPGWVRKLGTNVRPLQTLVTLTYGSIMLWSALSGLVVVVLGLMTEVEPVWLVLTPVLMFAAALHILSDIGALQGANTKRFTLNDQRILVDRLRMERGARGEVHIAYLTNAQKMLATTLKGVFEQAGWEVNWSNLPVDAGQQGLPMFTGIEVRAYNEHRVNSISDLLTKAGLVVSRTAIDPFTFTPDHPKFRYLAEVVRIQVGFDT